MLTLIGGGVFGNDLAWIREAVLWACDEAAARGAGDLDVWVNARDPLPGWDRGALEADCAARRGRDLDVGA